MNNTTKSNEALINLIRSGYTAAAISWIEETPLHLAQTVELEHNHVAVQLTAGGVLVVGVPDGWDDVKRLVEKVIDFNDTKYCYSGWNSDRNEAYFKPSASFGRIY
jgi:hypothetical protein